jgi:metal-dependent amidase/aminoacylase/carboxypeptidase family protein
MPLAEVVQELKEEGFGVKVADGGIIASLQGRKPRHNELVGAVSDLEGLPMETMGGGVFIRVGEFS